MKVTLHRKHQPTVHQHEAAQSLERNTDWSYEAALQFVLENWDNTTCKCDSCKRTYEQIGHEMANTLVHRWRLLWKRYRQQKGK